MEGNEVRNVILEVVVAQELALPHMFEFVDGLRALATLTGRAPLCLKCDKLGHLCFGCPAPVCVVEVTEPAVRGPAAQGPREEAGSVVAAPAEDQ